MVNELAELWEVSREYEGKVGVAEADATGYRGDGLMDE